MALVSSHAPSLHKTSTSGSTTSTYAGTGSDFSHSLTRTTTQGTEYTARSSNMDSPYLAEHENRKRQVFEAKYQRCVAWRDRHFRDECYRIDELKRWVGVYDGRISRLEEGCLMWRRMVQKREWCAGEIKRLQGGLYVPVVSSGMLRAVRRDMFPGGMIGFGKRRKEGEEGRCELGATRDEEDVMEEEEGDWDTSTLVSGDCVYTRDEIDLGEAEEEQEVRTEDGCREQECREEEHSPWIKELRGLKTKYTECTEDDKDKTKKDDLFICEAELEGNNSVVSPETGGRIIDIRKSQNPITKPKTHKDWKRGVLRELAAKLFKRNKRKP